MVLDSLQIFFAVFASWREKRIISRGAKNAKEEIRSQP